MFKKYYGARLFDKHPSVGFSYCVQRAGEICYNLGQREMQFGILPIRWDALPLTTGRAAALVPEPVNTCCFARVFARRSAISPSLVPSVLGSTPPAAQQGFNKMPLSSEQGSSIAIVGIFRDRTRSIPASTHDCFETKWKAFAAHSIKTSSFRILPHSNTTKWHGRLPNSKRLQELTLLKRELSSEKKKLQN